MLRLTLIFMVWKLKFAAQDFMQGLIFRYQKITKNILAIHRKKNTATIRSEITYQNHKVHFEMLWKSFVLLIVIFLDPFQLSALTTMASKNIFDRLHAIITPAPESDRITIILIDMKTLSEEHEKWPPSFGFWRKLLSEIPEYDPSTIFVDVYFGNDRSISEKDDIVTIAKNDDPAKPRIFFADYGQNALRNAILNGDCLEWEPDTADPMSENQIPSSRCRPSALFPRLRDAVSDRRAYIDWSLRDDRRLYPLHTLHAIPMDQKGDVLTVASSLPATVLARDACRDRPGRPAGPAWCKDNTQFLNLPDGWSAPLIRKQESVNKAIQSEFDPALLPRWSLYRSPESDNLVKNLNRYGCVLQKSNSPTVKFFQAIGILPISTFPRIFDTPYFRGMFELPSLSSKDPEQLDENGNFTRGVACPHFLIVHASDILAPTGGAEQGKYLSLALKNKIVLIGMSFNGTDQWPTPLYGNIPGVFIHAAALETLLHYGPNYPTKSNEHELFQNTELFKLSNGDIIEILMNILFMYMATIMSRNKRIIFGGVLFFIISITLPYICFFLSYGIPSFISINVTEKMVFTISIAVAFFIKIVGHTDKISPQNQGESFQ